MAKVKVIVTEEDLLGKGDNEVLSIEVREFITKDDVVDAINFAQKLVRKGKEI